MCSEYFWQRHVHQWCPSTGNTPSPTEQLRGRKVTIREKPAIEWGQLPAVAVDTNVDTNVATMLLNGALLCGQFQKKSSKSSDPLMMIIYGLHIWRERCVLCKSSVHTPCWYNSTCMPLTVNILYLIFVTSVCSGLWWHCHFSLQYQHGFVLGAYLWQSTTKPTILCWQSFFFF